ncbi:MAG: UDP-glucose--hexose-1-phosphate uridylyltransferase [Coprobacillaceae bacterium]
MNFQINRLLNYALQKKLISEEDKEYTVNLLLELLNQEEYEEIIIRENLEEATPILKEILDKAVTESLIEDTITSKDLFDTKIMNCLMPRPSEVVKNFYSLYHQEPELATKYYYDLSIASNYIRKSRTDKNISFNRNYKYGDIEITINLSKPEKDPKEIAKARLLPTSKYPRCLLCKENVGFQGTLNLPARQNHRIIPITLDDSKYYLQYSPYVYYNEHCIILNDKHIPMIINRDTFSHLLSFVEQFPHYMAGSNADLPIVGGSILSHDHFQGGNHIFPMDKAKVLKQYHFNKYPNIKIEILYWPLSTIRLRSINKSELVSLSTMILEKWKGYSDESVDIIAYSGDERHNTITPIARKKGINFQLDLVLRNNRTSDKNPDGIFHPHKQLHHIKKENIGLIEVMGLAILPARLKEELKLLEICLLGEDVISNYDILQKHQDWYQDLLQNYTFTKDNIKDILKQEVTIKFVQVLEDAGVFKMNEEGIQAFETFIKKLEETI